MCSPWPNLIPKLYLVYASGEYLQVYEPWFGTESSTINEDNNAKRYEKKK